MHTANLECLHDLVHIYRYIHTYVTVCNLSLLCHYYVTYASQSYVSYLILFLIIPIPNFSDKYFCWQEIWVACLQFLSDKLPFSLFLEYFLYFILSGNSVPYPCSSYEYHHFGCERRCVPWRCENSFSGNVYMCCPIQTNMIRNRFLNSRSLVSFDVIGQNMRIWNKWPEVSRELRHFIDSPV